MVAMVVVLLQKSNCGPTTMGLVRKFIFLTIHGKLGKIPKYTDIWGWEVGQNPHLSLDMGLGSWEVVKQQPNTSSMVWKICELAKKSIDGWYMGLGL